MNPTSKFDNIHFTCKPADWADIFTDDAITNLEGLERADILGATPHRNFVAPAPSQYFVAKNEHGQFLINTEGYNYPRYIARIKDTIVR